MPSFRLVAVIAVTSIVILGCQARVSLLGQFDSDLDMTVGGTTGTESSSGERGGASASGSSASGGASASGSSASGGSASGGSASGGASSLVSSAQGGTSGAASSMTSSGVSTRPILPAYAAPIAIASLATDRGINTDPGVTGNGLELFFMSTRTGNMDIYHVSRSSRAESWSTPSLVSNLSSDATERNIRVSADGLRLWFFSDRDRALGTIWQSTRKSLGDEFGTPSVVPGLSEDGGSLVSACSNDASTIAVVSALRPPVAENYELIELTRATEALPFLEKGALVSLNSPSDDYDPWLSGDGLTIVFHSNRSGSDDLYVSSRKTTLDEFDPPQPMMEVNTEANEASPALSSDFNLLYFASDRDGAETIYVVKATR